MILDQPLQFQLREQLPQPTLRPTRRPIRILVAEDDVTIRSVLVQFFALYHYEVIDAPDGATALTLALERRPDLVITDVCMPGCDGPGLLTALADRGLGDVPTIAISAQRCPESLSADRFIEKPFDLDTLLEAVTELTGKPSSASYHPSNAAARNPG
jgi:CheY-like chemotaxis protein